MEKFTKLKDFLYSCALPDDGKGVEILYTIVILINCLHLLVYILIKVKVKVALWGFSTLRPFGLLYSYPQQVPAFISRGATHHTDARDFYQRRRELLPMNFASKSVIHEILLHAAKLGPGPYYFTSPSKEGILRIFRTPEKSSGFGRF